MFTGSTETIDPKEIESLRTELTRVQKIWRDGGKPGGRDGQEGQ